MTPDKVVALAIELLKLVTELVGTRNAKGLLSEEQALRANAVADALEYVKFGRSSASDSKL